MRLSIPKRQDTLLRSQSLEGEDVKRAQAQIIIICHSYFLTDGSRAFGILSVLARSMRALSSKLIGRMKIRVAARAVAWRAKNTEQLGSLL